MPKGTTTLRSRLALATISGVLVAIASLFWIDSPPRLFAQTDTTSPAVSSVAITSDTGDDEVYLDDDGVYGIGDKIEMTVTFDEDVTVTGSPQLEITIGTSAKDAAYKSTTDSEVVFSYTVVVGGSDTDGISIGADKLSLNGGSIKDGADNDAELSHTALSAQSGHMVDGIRPTITSAPQFGASTFSNDGIHTVGEILVADIEFSENVYVGGHPGPQLKLNFNGTTKSADFGWASPECVPEDGQPITLCVFSPGPFSRHGISLAFKYEIAKGDLDLDGVAINANSVVLNGGSIRDGAGNDAVLTHSAIAEDSDYIVDGVPATVSSIAITSDPGSDETYGTGDRVEVTVTMTEDVIVSSTYPPELTLDIGGSLKRAGYRSENSGKLVFSYVIQDGLNDDNGISFPENSVRLYSGGTTGSYTVSDATGTSSFGSNHADLSFNAVAADSGHKVATSVQPPESTDATLSGLTLSGVDFGTFASGTTSYWGHVPFSVATTTVTPTLSDSGASYVIKRGSQTYLSGIVSLSSDHTNYIDIEVTAEDDYTRQTYTVTVYRPGPPLTDATLSRLSLTDVDFGPFKFLTHYSARVANSVTQTTVTPTLSHSGASYVIKLEGVTDSDGVIDLAVGRNPITIEVTAEDGNTTKTYNVSVTREEPSSSTDATLSALTLSGIDFGIFASGTTSYTADVSDSVTETTITPTVNHSGASYVIKLGGVEDADGDVSLAEGSNVITVEVTAEDGETTLTYTFTVTRLATSLQNQASTDATLSGLTLSGVDFGTFASSTTSYTAQVGNEVPQTTVTPTVNDLEATYVIKLGGVEDADGEISLAVGSNVITVEVTAEDEETTQTYTVTVTRAEPPSTDATLSVLTLSGIDFGTFASGTTSYTAQAAYSVSETTVTPTVNDSGASYVIKLGGVTEADGVIALSVGSNVITIEVTAEDDSTTRTYTVTITRATPPSTDAMLSALTLSGINFGTFASGTTSYTAQVANSVTETTVTPTVNDSGASYVIKLGGVEDAAGEISLAVGSNVITVEVTAEDDSTTRTYTVTVIRAEPPSTDATLGGLTLSGIDFGTFASGTTSYTAQVAYGVSETAVTPTVNDSGAGYVVKLGGVTDADGVIILAVGSNVITIEVTAEDDSTTRTYTVTVTRAAPSTDSTLSGLTLSGINFGTFAAGTTSYSAQVPNSVSQTTVTPTVNDSGASHVIKLGGVTDADGVITLGVGSNVIAIEVTAEDDATTRTYTVTVTRAEPPSTDATLKGLTLSGVDFGTFDSTTTSYTAQVANSVSQTTVTPAVNDSGASHVIKLGGVTEADGVVTLSVGSNVITIEVTAEDDGTTRTYTVTVTRAEPPSTDATLSALTLSGIDFGTFTPGTTSYSAQAANDVAHTTVTPTVNDSGASHVIKLGGVTDADGVVVLSVGGNVITVEVTAEDDSTTRTYTVTVTRAEPLVPELSSDATLTALTLSGVDFGTFDSTTTSYTALVSNVVTQTTVTPTVNHSEASYVIKLGGVQDVDG